MSREAGQPRSAPPAGGGPTPGLAPAHAWELRGEGSVAGEIDPIVRLLRRCSDEELIRVRDVRLFDRAISAEAIQSLAEGHR